MNKDFLPECLASRDESFQHFYENEPGLSPAVAGIFMEDILNQMEGSVEPDTLGAEFFFLEGFITTDMALDFELIEHDFMKRCYEKLREFSSWRCRCEASSRESSPESAHKLMVLELILNGAQSGDSYCIGLLRYLYKTYHKQEYNQLKRFKKISGSEILSLTQEQEDEGIDEEALGRIVTICPIFNIVLDASCSILFAVLEKRRQSIQRYIDELDDAIDFSHDDFEECFEQICAWLTEDEKNASMKQGKYYKRVQKFIITCMENWGYPRDYVLRCLENNMGLHVQLTRTYVMLRKAYPNHTITFEEVQRYTHLYSALAALVDVSEELDNVNRIVLGRMGDDELEMMEEDSLFVPEKIVVPSDNKSKESPAKFTNVAPIQNKNGDEKSYLSEIDELRRRLSQKEMQYNHLKMQYLGAKKEKKETDNLLAKYQNDREELLSLREFVYNLESDVPNVSEASPEQMKNCIKTKKIAIIGGHINWIKKMKKEFPDWEYVRPSTYNSVDKNVIENKDMLFFFTDYVSHAAYGKVVAIARDKKIPFSYLHGVNMEMVIRQIYEKVR